MLNATMLRLFIIQITLNLSTMMRKKTWFLFVTLKNDDFDIIKVLKNMLNILYLHCTQKIRFL